MKLTVVPGTFAICRLDPSATIPAWALGGDFVSIVRTSDELSIVCRQENVLPEIRCDGNWRCLKVQGPLDFALTGVLASIAMPLARAGISIFSVSTFDTDYMLVKASDLSQAVEVLRQAGHGIQDERT
ncbi:MAG: ACT domain-containing protein [Chloroflexi bacterium]|nr:ACT domain-containing protein [Chloroflexota bacterium]